MNLKRLTFLLLLSCVPSIVFAAVKDFTAIELSDLEKTFKAHEDEGPGMDYYKTMELRLHLPKAEMPLATDANDQTILKSMLGPNARYKPIQYGHKFVIHFPSNANWAKEATLTFYINDELYADFLAEVAPGDEFYLFFQISEFNTFSMSGKTVVADFLNVQGMKSQGLLK